MLNFPVILNYIHAIIVALSILSFIEILFKFKKPQVLKVLLLSMVFSIGFFGFGKLYIYMYGYNRVLSELPIVLFGITAVNFLYQLYRNTISLFVIICCLFLILLNIAVPLYFHYEYNLSFLYEDFYVHPKTAQPLKLLRLVAVSFFLFLGINLLSKIIKEYKNDNIYYRALKGWCVAIISTLVIAMILNVFDNVFPGITFLKVITNTFLCLFQVIIIMYRPSFMNNIPIDISVLNLFSNKRQNKVNSDKFVFLFFTQLFYLKEKATIHDLATEMEVGSEELLEYVRLNYNINFVELINKNRILYFMDLMNSPENHNFTLETLAKKSGFSSRQNLHKSFKKYHGGNPSDLILVAQS
jgi:AraC-like DNA-binding protein